MSEYLHCTYGYKILALDCDEQRIKTARLRNKSKSTSEIVKYATHSITESSMEFIKERIMTEFNMKNPNMGFIGLHACGDLTITALKLATANPDVHKLIIMPCCYHRMTLSSATEFQNFPLSRALTTIVDSKTVIMSSISRSVPMDSDPDSSASRAMFHRPFLRLACQQSVKQWQQMNGEEHRIHGNRMYTRSLVGALAAAGNELTGTL